MVFSSDRSCQMSRDEYDVLIVMFCVSTLYPGPKAAVHGAEEGLSCWRNQSDHRR